MVPGPSGKWYFNHGNIGADVTFPDGRKVHASSYYSQNPQSIGKRSSDGRLYVGGFGVRMNPDGTGAEVIFDNTRNTHAMCVNSFGDVYHADNDDPAHARATWVMEYSNYGYACLEDGNRSWEDSAKSWEKKVVSDDIAQSAYEEQRRSSLRRDEGHWREHVPGTTPPGNMWGPGAPTGDYFVEGDELGADLRGQYLVCETVHRAIFRFTPKPVDSHIALTDLDKRFFAADRASENKAASGFLPSDIVANTDGSLFVADWNSLQNRRGNGNALAAIYRITRADEKTVTLPTIDFTTTPGLLAALTSPSPGVRWVAHDKLRAQPDAFPALKTFVTQHANNPFYQARAVFIMARLDDPNGAAFARTWANSDDPQQRMVALRALRHAEKEAPLSLAKTFIDDPSPALRREAILLLRNVPFADAKPVLAEAIASYDGSSRYLLEAIGAVADGRLTAVYDQLIRPTQTDPTTWDARQKNLAWRIRSPQALADLADCMIAQNLPVDEFRQLAYTFSVSRTAEERAFNVATMDRFKTHPAFANETYQGIVQEFLDKDINDPPPITLAQSYLIPQQLGAPTTIGTDAEIAALKPNVANGKNKAAVCMICHQINGNGVAFGPTLSNWGQVRPTEEIVRAITQPAADIAHGFDKPVVVTQKGHRLEGLAKGYSWHAGALRVKTVGGEVIKVAHRRPNAKIDYLKNHSWMPPATAMGLSSQDVRDIAEYLRTLASE